MSSNEALEALERREYERALSLLKRELATRPDGELHALAGLASFQLEDYDAAAQHYSAALLADGQRSDWREMRAVAQANATAGVNVHVPALHYFDRNALLAPPSVRKGALPPPLPAGPGHGHFKRLRLFLGELLGSVATVLMDSVTDLVGWIAGYRDKVWTNWYHRPLALEVLTLAYMREQLNAHNLKSTYPAGTLVGFQQAGQRPPLGVSHFRTADGSWNNLADPKEGAAGTRFLRNVELSAIRPESGAQLLTPNPREISRRLLTRPSSSDGLPVMTEVPFLNLLAASWIQFMNDDWINHGEILFKDVIEVPLPPDDPACSRYLQSKMFIGRTQPDPTRIGNREPAATSSINEVTHWWDGSQIYGSDQDTQNRVRSGRLGKMRLNSDGTLPVDGTGVEDTGFRRNWWVGLSMLHTLFVREHNAICDMLHEAYPDWDDNRLFNVARLINAAVMAKIHSIEWTPAILPNPALDLGLNVNWYGLLTFATRKGRARKTLSEVKVRNAEIGGIVGNPINRHGCAFGLTEEFVEVYRLHSLLPETLQLRRRGQDGIAEEVPFPATRQRGSPSITQRHAMSDLFYSFGNQHPGALVLNNFPRFMQELSVPGNSFFDMGTVDIVRARERGVPRYNEFRRQLGLNPIRSFDDLTDEANVRNELKSVYGNAPEDVENLDLLIGTLAEAHRPTGFGFGETLFQIFILNASRRLQADRFYTDCFTEDVYTPEGLHWIDRTDLKTVILRHYPELADTGLANIKNAFEPWDEGPQLDPKRHPLREWDAELKHDPWRGDAYHHAHSAPVTMSGETKPRGAASKSASTGLRRALASQQWRETGHLSLSKLKLRTVGELAKPPAGLRSLDLSGNRLVALPRWIWRLDQLERLNLADNRLETLSPDIGRLAQLRQLDVSDNIISKLPDELANCHGLRTLNLYGNTLTRLDPVDRLDELLALNAARNLLQRVDRLPASLVSLDLSDNELEDLPSCLADLRGLRRLDVSGNRLSSVHWRTLAGLPLQQLYLDDNRLESLPPPEQLPDIRRLSGLNYPLQDWLSDTGHQASTLADDAIAAVERHVSRIVPETHDYASPTYSVGSLSITGQSDAAEIVNLYYKRFDFLPAQLELGDQTAVPMNQLSRKTALELVGQHQPLVGPASIRFIPITGDDLLERTRAFLTQGILRVGEADLVSESDVPDVHFSQPSVAPRRVLNVALADSSHEVLDQSTSPTTETEYLVRVDIGPKRADSALISPPSIPTAELLATSSRGYWFDVIIDSTDVAVTGPPLHRLFLPFSGPSWVCPCEGEEHTCSPADRQPFLYVPIRTSGKAGPATLRCTIYNRNNAVQSARVEFVVGATTTLGNNIRGFIDYCIANDVGDAELLAPRDVNVLTNDSPSGTHSVIIKTGDCAIQVHISDDEAGDVLTDCRTALTNIVLSDGGKDSNYDIHNRKETGAFIDDLKTLARLGSDLWAAVVPEIDNRVYLTGQLRHRSKIQINRVTRTVFPWALVYDIPRDADVHIADGKATLPWELCRLLKEWNTSAAGLADYPDNCPYQTEHGLNTLCPYGFWGFRHLIEQPPTVSDGTLRDRIRMPDSARAVTVRSLQLNAELMKEHFTELQPCLSPPFELLPCDSRATLQAALADPTLPIVYFYCHGATLQYAGEKHATPILKIGQDQILGPKDFGAWAQSDNWGPSHWQDTAPLIFINGCETANLMPEDVVTFVGALAGVKAAGVVGTEISVHQRVAGEVAVRFYRQFCGDAHASVGLALYRMRIDLLCKGNVSGLVYTPYCSMDLMLEPSQSTT